MDIGIDFGSTYSVVSRYDELEDRVEAIPLCEGASGSIPSVVSMTKPRKQGNPPQIAIGPAAKLQAGKRTVRIFEGFKILLTESNLEMLKKRGYDNVYSPREITKIFLSETLRKVSKNYNNEPIENLVICVPEIWGRNPAQNDGRVILRDVLRNEIFEDEPKPHIRVVTEPEAASAFIAFHYEKTTGRPFNGHLLLIDYGGGTLDITLTEVSSDENGLEISYREGGGAGENHPDDQGNGTIGTAGIAYMQAVVINALREAGLLGEDEFPNYSSPAFVAAVTDLESQIKSRGNDIEDAFSIYGSYYSNLDAILDEEEELDFAQLEYGDEAFPVTYQQLFRAYRDTIENVLKREVQEINRKVREHIGADPCEPEAGLRDDFKIALVGGFGSFYLVKQQLAEIYKLDADAAVDMRTKSIPAKEREQAISFGAALLAAGKVKQKKTARFSIGLCTKNAKNGQPDGLYYGIRYHQIIEPGTPYFILYPGRTEDKPENRVVWGGLYGNISSFAIEFSDSIEHGCLMDLKLEMLNRLRDLPTEGTWYCGFSMDENEIVSFHVEPRNGSVLGRKLEPVDIALDSYARMFNLTALRDVEVPQQ